tara:strand:+ start:235 stop:525 length:291 start_codon:yes stop_codon:yes gene_type:complete
MNVKLTQNELIDLIVDILTNLELESEGETVSFHKLGDESELGEQESGTSDAGQGVGTSVMGTWDSGLARGVANQIGVSVGSSTEKSITRGKANPLW